MLPVSTAYRAHPFATLVRGIVGLVVVSALALLLL